MPAPTLAPARPRDPASDEVSLAELVRRIAHELEGVSTMLADVQEIVGTLCGSQQMSASNFQTLQAIDLSQQTVEALGDILRDVATTPVAARAVPLDAVLKSCRLAAVERSIRGESAQADDQEPDFF